MDDRWCTRCNTFQTARVCARCKHATEALIVWSPGTPKVRCYCRAPFESLRLANESGMPLMIGWEGSLKGEVLTVTVTIDCEGQSLNDPTVAVLPRALRCPHCSREMLLARAWNRTRLPVKTDLKLRARPDGGVVLFVTATKGTVTHGH